MYYPFSQKNKEINLNLDNRDCLIFKKHKENYTYLIEYMLSPLRNPKFLKIVSDFQKTDIKDKSTKIKRELVDFLNDSVMRIEINKKFINNSLVEDLEGQRLVVLKGCIYSKSGEIVLATETTCSHDKSRFKGVFLGYEKGYVCNQPLPKGTIGTFDIEKFGKKYNY